MRNEEKILVVKLKTLVFGAQTVTNDIRKRPTSLNLGHDFCNSRIFHTKESHIQSYLVVHTIVQYFNV